MPTLLDFTPAPRTPARSVAFASTPGSRRFLANSERQWRNVVFLMFRRTPLFADVLLVSRQPAELYTPSEASRSACSNSRPARTGNRNQREKPTLASAWQVGSGNHLIPLARSGAF